MLCKDSVKLSVIQNLSACILFCFVMEQNAFSEESLLSCVLSGNVDRIDEIFPGLARFADKFAYLCLIFRS